MHIANLSMLYLVAILAAASLFGRGPAILAAVAAFLAFDWFFVEPVHTFAVVDPEEWVALLLFLLTAVLTGQLAAGQRMRAEDARRRERESVFLYDLTRLLGEDDLPSALDHAAERIRLELGLSAVVVEAHDERGQVADRSIAGDAIAARGASAAAASLSDRPGGTPRWVRIVSPHHVVGQKDTHVVALIAGGRRVGTLRLVPHPGAHVERQDERGLSAAGVQIGAAIERARLRRSATETEVLQRADQLKNALLRAVSHDLRTPLASIVASAGSLRKTDVSWTDAERQGFVADIEEEARRLTRIVTNLLDLTRMEAGVLKPERTWRDLPALVDDVIGRLRGSVAMPVIRVIAPAELPPVLLDYVEIDQVLSNLIENCLRHAGHEREIEITLRSTGDEVIVEVADRGPGIAPAALGHVFEPFYRAPGPRSRAGIGLGLAVARGLVEAHGGRISVRARDGGGTVVAFTLPLEHSGVRT